MKYTHVQKNIGDSPRKLRLVADMVRKMQPEQAVELLRFTNRAAAEPLAKAIKTAIANTQGVSPLSFDKIEINEGVKMRRYRVGTAGRGRGRPYKRRTSHIKIVLTDEVQMKSEKIRKSVDRKASVKEVSETPATTDAPISSDISEKETK